MTTIRTPDDEVDKPGYFYPPFREGDWYQGATYGGHSDFSVDWNKRTRTGGWLDDRGEPVLAQADGTVAETDPVNGVVLINHWGGDWRTESRHMGRIVVKVGDRVQRGDKIGEIGANGIDPADIPGGGAPSPHLHVVHWRKVGGDWKRIKQSFLGEPVAASVYNSDSQPRSWNAPGPVMIQGPAPRATWESAYREAAKALGRAEKAASDAATAKGAAEDGLKQEKAARVLAQQAADELNLSLQAAKVKIQELQNASPPDCTVAVNTDRNALMDELTEWIAGHRA